MRTEWQEWIKKLALAYETGWEYIPGSEEPGSVLMDIFLEMAEENRKRYDKIWEKQESFFLQAVPNLSKASEGGRGALLIKASGEEEGRWLKEGTEAYAVRENQEPIRFLTACPIQLTSARLKYAVYRRGLWAWLSYEEGKEGPIVLFQPTGEVLARPVFKWRFQGLGDGRREFRFGAEFGGRRHSETGLSGKWSISDGERVYAVELQQEDSGFVLAGETPEFERNLNGGMYEICLEILSEEALTEEWIGILGEGFALIEKPEEREAELCLTDLGAGSGGKVFPFGLSPEEGACCYFACDKAAAGGVQEAELRFQENFLVEERLPEPMDEEHKKLYRKYPWLQRSETVWDWRVQEAVWEYFNGNLWRILPDSEGWQILSQDEGACERICRWKRPGDMAACSVEGEEHYYIRLRLRRVCNAYAAYYRKRIPVLEKVRFCTGGRRIVPAEEMLPAGMGDREEKMYLGFEGTVTCAQCWYTGEDVCSFDRKQLKGRDVLFERDAFWVELGERHVKSLSCFLPNYVPVAEAGEESEIEMERRTKIQKRKRAEEETSERGMEPYIDAGTAFYVEPMDMGMLDAVCLSDIRCGAGQPVLSNRQVSEHYFMHFDRMLTPMDVELMLGERYPLLRVGNCVYQEVEGVLRVELLAAVEKAASMERVNSMEKENLRPEEAFWEETKESLGEIEQLLERMAAKTGALWLKGCRVKCSLQELTEAGRETKTE